MANKKRCKPFIGEPAVVTIPARLRKYFDDKKTISGIVQSISQTGRKAMYKVHGHWYESRRVKLKSCVKKRKKKRG